MEICVIHVYMYECLYATTFSSAHSISAKIGGIISVCWGKVHVLWDELGVSHFRSPYILALKFFFQRKYVLLFLFSYLTVVLLL